MKRIISNLLVLLTAGILSSGVAAREQEKTLHYPATLLSEKPTVSQMGGVYSAYPDEEVAQTPAPGRYKPFFVGHIGRHGSRYHNSDALYTKFIKILDKAYEAGQLTEAGADIRVQMNKLYDEAKGHMGALVPRGAREHQHIIARLCRNYPEIFADAAGHPKVVAYSTQIKRVIESMDNGMETLKSCFPDAEITKDSSDGVQKTIFPRKYLNAARKANDDLINDYSDAMDFTRLIDLIFTDRSALKESQWSVVGQTMWLMAAGALQLDRTDIDLYRYMTYDEIRAMWSSRCRGLGMALGPSELWGDRCKRDMVPEVSDIIKSADAAIADPQAPCASFHYCHDTNMMPLTHLLGIEGCCNGFNSPDQVVDVWRDYFTAPMAGNVQIILFRKPKCRLFSRKYSKEVLVKVLLNEHEVAIEGLETDRWPYYRWSDFKSFIQDRMDAVKDL